jgi:hypothetical protein
LVGLSRFQQASASQKLFDGSIHLMKVCFSHRLAGDDDHVPAICYHRLAEPGCFPHETLGAVANHRPSHPPTCRKTKAAVTQIIAQDTEDQKWMSPATVFSTHPLEIRVLSKAKPLFHCSIGRFKDLRSFLVMLLCGFQSAFFAPIYPNLQPQPWGPERLQLNCQPFTALAAAGLDHFSPTFGTHPGSKAVHLFAAPLLGLISSFRHNVPSSLSI